MVTGSKPISKPALRHYGIVMAFAVFGILTMLYGSDTIQIMKSLTRYQSTEQPSELSSATTPGNFDGLERSLPVRLLIPSIKLDTTFVEPLTLNADKTVSVPGNYTQVGWYSGGAAPGEVGPAVILGHVDSKVGPGVFYSLGQVQVGDIVKITRQNGVEITFEVSELHRYPQSDFPTLDVYGPTNYPALRLVTCTGMYDHGKQQYSHNLVVYAKLRQ